MSVLVASTVACEVDSEPAKRPIPLAQAEAEVRRALCNRVYASTDCRCEQWTAYSGKNECEEDVASAIDELRQILDAPDGSSLEYDAQCMGSYVHLLDTIACRASYAVPDECERPCLLIHGSLAEDEPCQRYGEWVSDCAQGLVCQGRCIDPCGSDDPDLYAGLGESCEQKPCAEGLVCDFNDGSRCEALPTAGEPCPLGVCESGSFCEVDPADPTSEPQCYAPRALGEPCRGHMQCQSGYCPIGFCDIRPAQGESCAGVGVCASGLDCIDEVCVPGDSILCQVEVPYF